MAELIVRLGDKNMANEVKVSFFVGDVQLSTGWPRNLGTWTCASELLGKGYSGQYWMGNFELPRCADRKELYHLQCDLRPLTNPVAFFSDFGESLPFLILYGFDLKGGGWRHGDKFHRDTRNRIEPIVWDTRSSIEELARLRQEALKVLTR
jgi:hypothetical protein